MYVYTWEMLDHIDSIQTVHVARFDNHLFVATAMVGPVCAVTAVS